MEVSTRHGDGEDGRMATRVRAFDWAATELGAITSWQPSLATTVEIMLANPCPMLLWWGERAIQIYNDAARRDLLADRDRNALGAPAARTWVDVWSRLGPAVDSVRAGGGAAVFEHMAYDLGLVGRHWVLTLGAVPDGRGGLGGVLVIAREINSVNRTIPEPTPEACVRILLAESQPDLRDELARGLGARWQVEAVADGQAALAALERGRFDLVIAEHALPGVDGPELLRRIRQRADTSETPVTIVSARPGGHEVQLETIDMGIDDYPVSPIHPKDLVACVGVQLRLAAARQDRARLLAVERAACEDAERRSAYLHSIVMQAPVPLALLRGPQHILELTNAAMAEAWGRAANESVGRPVFEIIPEARAEFQSLLDAVFATGKPRVAMELPFRTERATDGTTTLTRYANVLYAPLRDVKGQIDGVIVIAVDITDQIRSRHEMDRLRAQAEAANRAKDEFLAILGHELRNPLSPILTALQVMRLRGASGRELDVIERQVDHLTQLVDDLLDVSRAVRGKIELHRRDIELADVVAEALEVTSPLLEQRRHPVDVDVPRHDLCVNVDPSRMVQAISNLLSNAATYSEPGSRITIRAVRTDGNVRLSVRDSGVGIAPELIGRVFDLFVQQPQTIERAHGGLGLGLPIVRSLVELHGGAVSAASEGVGHGSEFTIELPALARATSPAASEPITEPEHAPTHGRILVVDDNEDAAAMLGEALEHLGYQVAVAHDGPAALHLSQTFAPDIALLDIGLPVMDGYELAERLRAQRGSGDRPHLVAVTGYGQEADRQHSARAGFERHLVKPVNLGLLSEVVAELVTLDARQAQ